jgi:glycosyltransferase 2 family protein
VQARSDTPPAPSRLSAFLASRTGRVLRYAVSFGLLAVFAALVDWQSLRQLPLELDKATLTAAVVLAGGAFPLMAWRWWLLARVLGFRIPFAWAHRATWISQFYASVLPSGVGGEISRAFFVAQTGQGQRMAGLASIVWDRALGLLVLFAMAIAAAGLKFEQVFGNRDLALALFGAAAAVVVGAVLLWRADPAAWPTWLRNVIGVERCTRLAGALSPVRQSGRVLLAAVALSALVWLLDFAAIALLARSVHLPLTFLDVAMAGCVAYVASVIPLGVGGHGLREGALVFTLAALGLVPAAGPQRDAALLLALLLWAVTVFWSLVGGLLSVLSKSRPSKADQGTCQD